MSAAGGGRMSLPVSPSAYIYSHFKHVSGVPAPEGIRGVAISRLKTLDTLIEQLARMKQKPEPYFGSDGESAEGRINALIEQYENQIKTARAAQAVSVTAPYSASPATGVILNFTA
jgi:hypothetical protein